VRVLLVGGTGPVGIATIPLLLEDGWEVAVAHGGGHEPEEASDVEHLHGTRKELLDAGGPVERWRPDVLVDTFPGGATAEKAEQLRAVAERAVAAQVVAVSSMDVYQHCVDAGLGDGSGATELPRNAVPLTEDAPKRSGPYPGAMPETPPGGPPSAATWRPPALHDNVAMEAALGGAPRVTILRPGAIYGPHPEPHRWCLREWFLVGKVHRGEHRLGLPDGGTQLFQRVALERVGRAIDAAIHRAPAGTWACNVGDPRDFTFGGLAAVVAERLGWAWEPEHVRWPGDPEADDHPWNSRHPVLCDDERLRTVLEVTAPDPLDATRDTIDWMWERREELAALEPREG
jgi:nucleoside-diphosphate-sugar epimerase